MAREFMADCRNPLQVDAARKQLFLYLRICMMHEPMPRYSLSKLQPDTIRWMSESSRSPKSVRPFLPKSMHA